jgi:diguanylate cyclase (GGDEF)-like protein/putative nucleotidyltransferase with HDIG domain
MSPPAKTFIALVALLGAAAIGPTLFDFQPADPARYISYLVVALLASGLKVAMPTMAGTLSVNFVFVLVGILELSLPETMLLGCATTFLQCVWRPVRRPTFAQIVFNVATVATAIVAANAVFHSALLEGGRIEQPLRILCVAATFFLANSLPVAAVIALTERRPLVRTWHECYFWALPYYLAGAGIAGVFHATNRLIGWQSSILALPVVYLIYRAYRLYVGRLDDEVSHAEQMAALHLRTIEALALAIEAKDHTTHDHLRRVQVYAVEIGRDLGLSADDLEALRAASVLHDIGKLAVPEHIISKPGRLTPEEFEKMKIHPVVGAEILEPVRFPYPVAPIVRAHHEKWNGTGYPDGLKGDQIPLGARILAVVDCLDAIATDRQYRRALPLHEALKVVVSEAGKSFDPRVVQVLERRCVELEKKAQAHRGATLKLSTGMKVERGLAPAAGFEKAAPAAAAPAAEPAGYLTSIAAARQEVQALFELAQDLGASLSLDETLSVLAVRLKRMAPYDSMAIYVPREGRLHPVYVTGENFRLFSSLEIPIGQGLSGWVADTRKPILNGNPTVEPGYLADPNRFSTLRSALAVPLEGVGGLVGVLALYQAEPDAFTRDHLRILLAISGKIALSVENALKYRQAETSATTDFLTGLPNARSLFLHLDGELARCRRMGLPLAVLVCDMDGFKLVNDRFGHLEGNRLLKSVAAALRETCREYDSVARMGGDEFVLVLPGLRVEDVEAKAARLSLIAGMAGQDVLGEDVCTLSIGAAYYPEDGTDAEHLLAEADRRMYQAKQSRRAGGAKPAPQWALDWHSATVQ